MSTSAVKILEGLRALAEWTTGGLDSAAMAADQRPSLLEQASAIPPDFVVGDRGSRNTGIPVGTVVRGRLMAPPRPSPEQIEAAESECPSGTVRRSIAHAGRLWLWWAGGYWPSEVIGVGVLVE